MVTIRFAALLPFLLYVMAFGQGVHRGPSDSSTANISYIFASPNTGSGSAGGDAVRNLRSFEELNAISVADRITCSFALSASISGTTGVFDGQTEESFVVETGLSRQKIEYIASLLGKFEHQEFVLWFMPQSGGHDQLWTIRIPSRNSPHDPSGSSKDVIAAMQQLHVAGGTIRNTPATTEIWIVDFGGALGSAPDVLAAKLGGKATWEVGIAQLFGNDDRSKAAGLFGKKIDAFERATNTHISLRLESPPWKNATTRTCSSEVPD